MKQCHHTKATLGFFNGVKYRYIDMPTHIERLFFFGLVEVVDQASYIISVWLVVSDIFYVHPYLGKIPILTNIFSDGLKPPTRCISKYFIDLSSWFCFCFILIWPRFIVIMTIIPFEVEPTYIVIAMQFTRHPNAWGIGVWTPKHLLRRFPNSSSLGFLEVLGCLGIVTKCGVK